MKDVACDYYKRVTRFIRLSLVQIFSAIAFCPCSSSSFFFAYLLFFFYFAGWLAFSSR